MSKFKDRILLVAGGTGSFGHAAIKKFIRSEIREIGVFSRDKKTQDDMTKRCGSPKNKFYIGDVRDPRQLCTRCAWSITSTTLLLLIGRWKVVIKVTAHPVDPPFGRCWPAWATCLGLLRTV